MESLILHPGQGKRPSLRSDQKNGCDRHPAGGSLRELGGLEAPKLGSLEDN